MLLPSPVPSPVTNATFPLSENKLCANKFSAIVLILLKKESWEIYKFN